MKQFLFPVFFALMVVGSMAEAATVQKRSLEDSVVIFEPRLPLVEGGLPCQGTVKVNNEQVVVQTVPECATAVAQKLRNEPSVLLYSQGRKLIGRVLTLGEEHAGRGYLGLELSDGPLTIAEDSRDSDNEGTTAHYICDHIGGEGLISRRVILGEKSEFNGLVSYPLDDTGLPPGAGVFHDGKLLCQTTGSGQCLDVSQAGGRHKRSLSKRQVAECMLTKIKCDADSFMLSDSCMNGNGVGTCTHGGVNCMVQFFSDTSPARDAEIVTCNDCSTGYTHLGQMTGAAYLYTNGTLAPNQENPPECFARASALSTVAKVGTVALLFLFAAVM